MTTLSAAVASIPPTAHLVKHLHLESTLPRRDGDVTVCTQCSLDRLDKLEAQTNSWSGVICAAVMCPCPCRAESLRDAKECVRALHRRVEARRGLCRLDIILVAHAKRTNSVLSPCRDPWRYPVNALRNVALRSAATELVIVLDVDFLPGMGIQEQLWKADVYSGYLRACTDLRRLVILPALEESPVIPETIDSEDLFFEEKDYLQSALQIVSGGKASVEKLWALGKVRTFAADKYPRGHGPTDTGRWISSDATYEVQYEVDFEPYFLCSRRLVPWYDERFAGYGKNKIIHAFHTAVLDFRFWIHPEWFVVHVHHQGSMAWEATLGSDPHASTRLSDIKRLYAIAKHELLSLPTHSGVHLPPKPCACTVPTSLPSHSWFSWKSGHGKGREENEQMGHWSYDEHPSTLLLQTSNKKYIQALYDLRYHFCVSKLRPVFGNWPLRSKLSRNPRDITLVTVATADRLQRLSAQCRRWKGVICAAIYASPSTDVKDLERKLLALHLEVENAGTCRLDVTLMEPVDVENRYSCRPFGRRGMPTSDLCPINGLRNAALELATTDLVLILDVDLLPAPSLNDCFLDEQQYECLFRMVMAERTAVVVPSFEFTAMSRETSNTGNGKGEDGPPSQRPKESNSGSSRRAGKKAFEKKLAIQELRYISETEEMTGKGVHAICNGLNNGDLRGFHVKHYAAGHSPTDFEKWRQISEGSNEGDKTCCDVCRSYDITFAEGFEPFVICSRKLIPIFDERFRGYGFDKVTFFYHLYLSGFRFRVLLHSFALDILHPKSKDWMKTFGPGSDPLQHVRVKALYQRAKREICVVTGGSALANHVVDELPVHLMGSAKPPGLLSKSRKQFRTASILGENKSRSTLDGLQLAWQGVIHRQYNQHKTSLAFNDAEGEPSSVPSEEDETKTSKGVERADVSSSVPSQVGDFSTSISSGITDLSQRDHAARLFSSCFGNNSFWAQSIAYAASELKTFDSSNSVESLEEFEWDNAGWDLKCKSDSLSNCSVVKAPPKDSSSEKEWFQTGGYWLRIFMSAGSWSPQASRLAGITTGGVSVRSVLPIRATKEVVVRYMIRFPSTFEWVKGGTLPGLWVNDVLQANFGWRRGGEGHLSTALVGLSKTESDQQTISFVQKTSKLSRPFYFVPEQWHALQIAASVVEQKGTSDQDRTHVESNGQIVNKRSLSRHGSAKDGTVVELRAFVDFELVSTISYPYVVGRNLSTSSQDPGPSIGLLLSCYFGGKTQDWASTEDTHIDFSQNCSDAWSHKHSNSNRMDSCTVCGKLPPEETPDISILRVEVTGTVPINKNPSSDELHLRELRCALFRLFRSPRV